MRAIVHLSNCSSNLSELKHEEVKMGPFLPSTELRLFQWCPSYRSMVSSIYDLFPWRGIIPP